MQAVPNLISIFRICLVPVFIIVYFLQSGDVKLYPVLIYFIAGISDVLDGYVARKYEASSKLGMLLDPLGDKLMTVSVMVCIAIDGIIPVWAVIVATAKELLMGLGGFLLHKFAQADLMPANFLGKSSTFIFYIVCAALMLFRNIPKKVATAMIFGAIVLTILSLAGYFNKYVIIMKNRNKYKTGESGYPPQ